MEIKTIIFIAPALYPSLWVVRVFNSEGTFERLAMQVPIQTMITLFHLSMTLKPLVEDLAATTTQALLLCR
jgi:hypothetical protein